MDVVRYRSSGVLKTASEIRKVDMLFGRRVRSNSTKLCWLYINHYFSSFSDVFTEVFHHSSSPEGLYICPLTSVHIIVSGDHTTDVTLCLLYWLTLFYIHGRGCHPQRYRQWTLTSLLCKSRPDHQCSSWISTVWPPLRLWSLWHRRDSPMWKSYANCQVIDFHLWPWNWLTCMKTITSV